MSKDKLLHTEGKWEVTYGKHAPEAPIFGFSITVGNKQPITSTGIFVHGMQIISEKDKTLIGADGDKYFTPEEAQANAERIVTCVNAMQGLSNEEVEGLRSKLEFFHKELIQARETIDMLTN